MRKFKVFYSDNSGPKCEEFQGTDIYFEDKWFILKRPNGGTHSAYDHDCADEIVAARSRLINTLSEIHQAVVDRILQEPLNSPEPLRWVAATARIALAAAQPEEVPVDVNNHLYDTIVVAIPTDAIYSVEEI